MYKMWVIIRNELVQTFGDRNLLMIMLVTPLVVASMIGFAFSDVSGDSIDIDPIPVALVNHDRAVDQDGQRIAMGQSFVNVFVPSQDVSAEQRAENEVWSLIDAVVLSDEQEARSGVDSGRFVAALIIPSDFSANISQLYSEFENQPTTIELYANAESATLVDIVETVAAAVATRMNAGSIAIVSSIGSLVGQAEHNPAIALQLRDAEQNGLFDQDFSAAFSQQNQIQIARRTISGQSASFNPFAIFGAGQAVFFMMFTAMNGMNSILSERREGLLNRQLATPTNPGLILFARMFSMVCICFVQVSALLCAMSLVDSLFQWRFSWLFGDNLLVLVVTIIAIAWAAAGFASLVISLAKTPEQGNVIGGVIAITMGLLGGAFFNVAALEGLHIARFLSVNYWGVTALMQISQGNMAVQTHLLVLGLLGLFTFGAGFLLFQRRLDT
jgi:ABC-2 type transport system permease protein